MTTALALIIWIAIAAFIACILRVITSSWRHTGVALFWPWLAVFGAISLVGKTLAFIGDFLLPRAVWVGNWLTAGWLP